MSAPAETQLQAASSGAAYSAATLSVRNGIAILDKASMVVIIMAMGLMTAMVTLQVVWRYVLGSSIDSADEVSRLFFVWVMFLAIPHGVKYGVHVGVDLFIMALHPTAKDYLFRIVSAAGAALMAAAFYAAWVATLDKWQELMPTLPVTAAVYYIAVLICAAHSFLHLLLHAWAGQSIWEGNTL